MAERDYYEILGVARDATPEAIKKAYRGLARKYHPDVNPGDKSAEGRFKEVQSAYDILSDQEKRALYDRHGRAAFEGMAASGPRANSTEWASRFGEQGFENIDLSDLIGSFGGAGRGDDAGGASIFEDLMGRVRGARPGRQRGGRTLEARLDHPFLDRGQAAVRRPSRSSGARARRKAWSSRSRLASIPGPSFGLKGQGEPGSKGTPAGDLTITIDVEPHPYFKRDGQNLQVEVPISVSEAILGAKIDAPTLDGMKSLTIPPGSSSGPQASAQGSRNPRDRGQARR